MKCKICSNRLNLLFKTKVLNKYNVAYFKCTHCDYIQTEKPYWIKDAYKNAITDLDVGLVSRNIDYANQIYNIITSNFNYSAKFLDYASGYGLFVRIMRDKGIHYYYHDKYCENIFAKNFEVNSFNAKTKFEAVTALEFFEHLENPLKEIKRILSLTNTIIFSTELIPEKTLKSPNDWWYFVPETGQHISFYSKKTLKIIADMFGLQLFSSNNLHILSKTENKNNLFDYQKPIIHLPSLTSQDYEIAKKLIEVEIAKQKTKNQPKYIDTPSANPLFLIDSIMATVSEQKQKILDLETKFNQAHIDRAKLITQLHHIYNSGGWRILRRIYIIRDKLVPSNSPQKKILNKIENFLKEIKFIITKPQKKHRKINKKSKKIIYIGHSYHAKTQSTRFLIDFLRKHFNVTEILDDSWQGKPFPDVSFIDDSYLGVIFFQNVPPKEILLQIKNDNLLFFPMYDRYGEIGLDFWKDYHGLKIINFSSTLHQKLIRLGFESISLQYFPKPSKFILGDKNKIYFWQRISSININTVISLFPFPQMKIHLHTAIDPFQNYIKPSKEIIRKYAMTFSDWFKTREEMQEQIKKCSLYVAPREYEGIGLSFLEAMAMGKAVIAANHPTMNEYIVPDKTGYLFDVNNPQPLDLSNCEAIQKNTYEFMVKGYNKWIKERRKIIDFIYQ